MKARLLFVHALSPLHAGTGQGVGVIDLPIAREKATGLPYLPGSSIKGTLRDQFEPDEDAERNRDTLRVRIFGPETNRADEHAGAVQFTDQTLALLPVRSMAGTFAWVTSPYVLRRLARDAGGAEVTAPPDSVPEPSAVEQCVVTEASKLSYRDDGKVYLEDLDLTPDTGQAGGASDWARWLGERMFVGDEQWREMLMGRFCVVHDDMLSFLLNTTTEIAARVKIGDDSKTVVKGGLWYEESLPTETVLFGLTLAFPNKQTRLTDDEIFEHIAGELKRPLQFGGKATVGRGLCRVVLAG
ncbi:MAG: type III-B CRISPR module RAMP protein Cmr4 [Acidobacteria bacterium]|nr:type III-B CRISPR module RAMP protein Cmr4 [Acidobacteriota bacterium]